MCFSAEMDLAAGLVITGIGVDTLRQARTRDQMALAALPMVFGVHQLIETLVWWNLEGHVSDSIGDLAAWIYAAIALVVVPVLVPFAFLRLGTTLHPMFDRLFMALGLLAGTLGLHALGFEEIPRRIDGHHISYAPGDPFAVVTLSAYVIATCAPSLVARGSALRWFGLGNLVVVATLVWLDQNAVISLWCVWAAFTSVLINLHLRGGITTGDRPLPQLHPDHAQQDQRAADELDR
jgi:hypothetical protein